MRYYVLDFNYDREKCLEIYILHTLYLLNVIHRYALTLIRYTTDRVNELVSILKAISMKVLRLEAQKLGISFLDGNSNFSGDEKSLLNVLKL